MKANSMARFINCLILLIADNKLIVLNDFGSLMVADITEEGPVLLSQAQVLRGSGNHWTGPVIAAGRLYCRSGRTGDLACFKRSVMH